MKLKEKPHNDLLQGLKIDCITLTRQAVNLEFYNCKNDNFLVKINDNFHVKIVIVLLLFFLLLFFWLKYKLWA